MSDLNERWDLRAGTELDTLFRLISGRIPPGATAIAIGATRTSALRDESPDTQVTSVMGLTLIRDATLPADVVELRDGNNDTMIRWEAVGTPKERSYARPGPMTATEMCDWQKIEAFLAIGLGRGSDETDFNWCCQTCHTHRAFPSEELAREHHNAHLGSVEHDRGTEKNLRAHIEQAKGAVETARTALYDYLKIKGRVA